MGKKVSNGVHAYGDYNTTKENGFCNGAAVGSYTRTRAPSAITYTKGWFIVIPALVFTCPVFAMLLSYTIVKLDGNIDSLVTEVQTNGFLDVVYKAWIGNILGSRTAWKFIVPFVIIQLIFMKLLPGKITKGPVTPAGNVPLYKANGMLSYVLTLVIFVVCGFVLKLFNPADIYDHYLEVIGAMNVVSLVFCLGLTLKGRLLPTSTDSGSSGHFLFDYYWGTELYPRVFGWDVKMFTNCRFGLMSWPLLILSYAAKQHQTYGLSDSMIVSVAIQLVYITKFFHWEMGYMKTLDIMHDRAGFYLCWGCLVWVPSVYTSHTLYLTNHPNNLGLPVTLAVIGLGVLSVFLNYFADAQKEHVRNTQGNCLIWGKPPVMIKAPYLTPDGKNNTSILLASGWWGISRHFHYIPEILAAFCWSVPALFQNAIPYFYVVFLTILLIHRSIRDDRRCFEKYGTKWKQYCDLVPYKIVPYLF